jgi:hypothetical protein
MQYSTIYTYYPLHSSYMFPNEIKEKYKFVYKELITMYTSIILNHFIYKSYYHHHHHHQNHHHHHHVACRVLGLMNYANSVNSLYIFRRVVLDFISHMADISQLSVVVCLCPFTVDVVSICFRNFEFSLHLGWF